MHIVRDSDTIEHVDDRGDKLVLLDAPRKRDLIASNKLAHDEAIEELDKLKANGVDTDAIMVAASAKPDVLAAAQEAVRTSLPSPKVRRLRFGALAVRIELRTGSGPSDGESISGHQPLMEAYDNMDFASSAWVDTTVHEVWNAAIPSDASARGEGADVVVPEEPVGSTD